MPLRSTLLFLSRQSKARTWVETSPFAKRLSSRFVAGNTLEDALAACRKAQSEGIAATLDYLGENVTNPGEAVACRDMYLRTLTSMQRAGVEPNVSLKLTQFGIDLSPAECEQNVGMLVKEAAAIGGFVRIDMESSRYTDATLGIVTRLYERYGACGTVLQAYLSRSEEDAAVMSEKGIRIRLCKGAYLEPSAVAFPLKTDVDRNYLKLAGFLLTANHFPAIATHDERMIETVRRFVGNHGIGKNQFEFQMLYGIRRDLQRELVRDGYRLRLYIPFGEAWYPYFMRRLAERPANLLFLMRNLVRR